MYVEGGGVIEKNSPVIIYAHGCTPINCREVESWFPVLPVVALLLCEQSYIISGE